MPMEEANFKNRVDKVFGALFPSLPPAPDPAASRASSTPWSISDGAVERVQWNRHKDDGPVRDEEDDFFGFFSDERLDKRRSGSKSRRDQWEDDLSDLEDEVHEEEPRSQLDDALDEEEQIRKSIGCDSTLDHEDEEDEYDKVALGREESGERLYMNDVTDCGPRINFHHELPNSFEEIKSVARDPRANYLAARARLQEDKEGTKRVSLSRASQDDNSIMVDSQVNEIGASVKSILKRKQGQTESKPKKRVRFNADCKDSESEQSHDLMITESTENKTAGPGSPEGAPQVPDYIRNPSKYQCYTFDPTEEDEDANLQAYRDFCSVMKKSSLMTSEPERPVELPKSITFTPRKKTIGDSTTSTSNELIEPVARVSCPLGIAAGEQEEREACAMEEDDLEKFPLEKSGGSRRLDRQYRSKPCSDG